MVGYGGITVVAASLQFRQLRGKLVRSNVAGCTLEFVRRLSGRLPIECSNGTESRVEAIE
jgi:hypothetical protein